MTQASAFEEGFLCQPAVGQPQAHGPHAAQTYLEDYTYLTFIS